MRRPVVIALAAYALALVAFAAFVAVPFVTKKRETPAEVPSPPPLRTVDVLNVGPGSRLCMSDLVVSKQSREMRFSVGTYGKPGPALRASISAPGYQASSDVPGGYADNSVVRVPIPSPPRSVPAEVCVANAGQRKFAFYGAGLDPARSRVRVLLDNSFQHFTPTFAFADGRPSIAANAGVTAGRIAVFRGFLDHTWIVWVLAFAMVVVVPLLAALGLALSADQRRSDSSAE